MAKGTAILLAFGASMAEVISSVRDKYAEQRATASGWHGTAVVNIAAGEKDGEDASTFIVKGIKNGFEAYKLCARMVDTVEVVTGDLEEVE